MLEQSQSTLDHAINGVLYLSKECSFDEGRQEFVKSLLGTLPLLVIRVETLPRQALVELELYCNKRSASTETTKSQVI